MLSPRITPCLLLKDGSLIKTVRLGKGKYVGDLVNSVDRDEMIADYYLALDQQILDAMTVPTTLLGGAASLDDVDAVVSRFGVIGVSAISLFVFKGKCKTVLISYPDRAESNAMFGRAGLKKTALAIKHKLESRR